MNVNFGSTTTALNDVQVMIFLPSQYGVLSSDLVVSSSTLSVTSLPVEIFAN